MVDCVADVGTHPDGVVLRVPRHAVAKRLPRSRHRRIEQRLGYAIREVNGINAVRFGIACGIRAGEHVLRAHVPAKCEGSPAKGR